MNVINSMYDSWNIERLNSVTELFDINVLNAYAFDNQNETGSDLIEKRKDLKLFYLN